MNELIFRAYDIRGEYNRDFDDEFAKQLGLTIGTQVLRAGENTLYCACDCRLSSPSLTKHFIEGVLATGCDVIDIGCVPTPLLYYATCTGDSRSGVMITGSHNPAKDNGFKIVINSEVLSTDKIQVLKQHLLAEDFLSGQGKLIKQSNIDDYVNDFSHKIDCQRRLKVILDCANGATSEIAGALFEGLGCEVVTLFAECDGNFPNHPPDPSDSANLSALIASVKSNQADVGIAFDGDGDRMAVVTNEGKVILSDRVLMLFAKHVLAKNPKSRIVYDVKCSQLLQQVIEAAGGEAIMTRTGHSLIKATIESVDALLAGEMSGHFFFRDNWYGFDDGLYAAARLLEILSCETQSCHQVFAQLPDSTNTPELKIALADNKKFEFMEQFKQHVKRQALFEHATHISIDGLRIEFEDGWGLLRPSNTTPYLIARFEAKDKNSLARIQAQFHQAIKAVDESISLPF